MSTRTKAYLAAIFSYVLFGAALAITKSAYDEVNAFQFLFYRFALATPVAFAMLAYSIGKIGFDYRILAKLIPIEILAALANMLIYIGLSYTTSMQAALIISTKAIIITIAGVLLLHEIEDVKEWIGLSVASLGSLGIILGPYIAGAESGLSTFSPLGNGLIIMHVLVDTSAVILFKKFLTGIPKLQITGVSIIIHTIFFGILCYALGHSINVDIITNRSVLWPVLYMVLATAVGFPAMHYALTQIEASEVVPFSFLSRAIAIILAVSWLGETLFSYQVAGLIAILVGVYIAESRVKPKSIFHKLFHWKHDNEASHHHVTHA